MFPQQVAVAAGDAGIAVLGAELSAGLAGPGGAVIPKGALRCLNLQGVDYWGRAFEQRVDVGPGRVAALWFILRVAGDQAVGGYSGDLVVRTDRGARAVALRLDVRGPALSDRGYGDLWRAARLEWLDSTLGNREDVPPPFVPLRRRSPGWAVTMLDKVMEVSDRGLLASVNVGGVEALDAPVRLEVSVRGAVVDVPMRLSAGASGPLALRWRAEGAAGGVSVGILHIVEPIVQISNNTIEQIFIITLEQILIITQITN